MSKTKISKRWLSVFMALLMVVTSIPLIAMPLKSEAAMQWTPIASSDFTQATAVTNGSLGYVPTYNGMGNQMEWTTGVWTGNGDASNSEDGAIYIPDGYMYLSGYSGGAVPINGTSAWKVDFGFRFKTTNSGDDAYYNSDNYSFMKMYVFDDDLSNPKHNNNECCYFSQNANGICYSWEATPTAGAKSQATSITTGNGNLQAGVNYHYIAEFTGNRFIAYITDDSGKIVQKVAESTDSTFLTRLNYVSNEAPYHDGNPARIKSFKIGDDDDAYYFKGLEYRNITFYSGTAVTDTSVVAPENSDDKFLMAYFTGNYNLDNESLRYAVSSDGLNFHTLNEGLPVTTVNTANVVSYNTGNTSGANTTGHIRDPYVFRAQDGSYYVLATDLDTAAEGFNNNSKMLVWHLNNLQDIATTDPWAIDIRGMMAAVYGMNGSDYYWVHRAWAPQAIWDASAGKYMLYFSAKSEDVADTGTYLYYVYTSDFKTFDSDPVRLVNPGFTNIDADITYNSSDDLYYMWFKNEDTKNLYYATSPDCSGPYTNVTKFNNDGLEGPQVHRLLDGTYVLLADAYGSSADPAGSKQGVFRAYTSGSITGFSGTTTTNISNLYARHASVIRITNDEYNALINTFGPITSTTDVEYYFSGGTTDNGNTGWIGSTKDPGEHVFKVWGGDGTYSAKEGVLTLNNRNVSIED